MKERNIQDYFKIFKRDITKYLDLRYDYLKLEFVEIFSTLFSKIIGLWVIVMVGIISFTFILIALAFYLGDLLGATYWGFLIVAGIFLLFMVLFLLFKNVILTNPLIKALIPSLFDAEIQNEKKHGYGK